MLDGILVCYTYIYKFCMKMFYRFCYAVMIKIVKYQETGVSLILDECHALSLINYHEKMKQLTL